MTQLKMLSADDKIAEIRRLYFGTSKQTIEADLAKALDLLKSMSTEDERERATVFMEGLAEMRNDWQRERVKPSGGKSRQRPAAAPGARQAQSRAGIGPQRGSESKRPQANGAKLNSAKVKAQKTGR